MFLWSVGSFIQVANAFMLCYITRHKQLALRDTEYKALVLKSFAYLNNLLFTVYFSLHSVN
jgi:hypothetical protein